MSPSLIGGLRSSTFRLSATVDVAHGLALLFEIWRQGCQILFTLQCLDRRKPWERFGSRVARDRCSTYNVGEISRLKFKRWKYTTYDWLRFALSSRPTEHPPTSPRIVSTAYEALSNIVAGKHWRALVASHGRQRVDFRLQFATLARA
jgi:hypothetical protein